MKLIYIKSTMEPKDYAALRSLLKQEQGEKLAPYVFKLTNTETIQEYLRKEKITYEVYSWEEPITKKSAKRPREDEEEEPTSSKKRRRDDE
ncbi:hypothetical protein [endosymbiont GvMRE of Glomus versiforme]|uniref:hypothetical protein n=1 Tax=endosymbiont GvMRE of Glomus versiforme TaxID=2039283 RepID=UPI000ED98913|nr:hypothetical protein [endosymbiont GvMRE of Glomus versiforme]RHZ36933.1 hypothetical protein GvMRE_I2g324 [endosymbiont GvMRE of Glomus versiforme]